MVKENSKKTFYWDGSVIAMEENHTPAIEGTAPQGTGMHYYFLDELGSPVRVNGYQEEGTPSYLTYGYDEFGNDLYEDLEEAGIPNPYSRQGEEQPFGYTGYRYDKVSSTYFAQAREYQPENGRFHAEDVIKGNGAFPETLNHYGYCLNNPLMYVDLNGEFPWIIIEIVLLPFILSGCGNQIDESEIEPVPNANSDYIFQNSMDVYNSKEYKNNTNCYAYAFDMIENPITGEKFSSNRSEGFENPWGMQPGMFSNQYNSIAYSEAFGTTEHAKNTFINIIEADATALGLEFQKYEEGMNGGYLVAVAMNPYDRDYHFYRENGDGTWSCKRGKGKISSEIDNPQIDAYKEGYTEFLGYYYVTQGGNCGIEEENW